MEFIKAREIYGIAITDEMKKHKPYDIQKFKDTLLTEDNLGDALWALAEECREWKKKGYFTTFRSAYNHGAKQLTKIGRSTTLEKLENAIERGAKPIVEIVGYGASADAHHITQPAPGGEGGARAMMKSLDQASISPNDINYINAHGTSTQLNDKFETMAMKSVFGSQVYKIPINSTKSMVGHLLGASGAIEAAVTILSIKNSMIHPTANLENPDPECDLDYNPGNLKKLSINYAMSNSFGFGGHNTSLIFKKFE